MPRLQALLSGPVQDVVGYGLHLAARGATAYDKVVGRGIKLAQIDYVDVVVHVFHGETRELYSLETLWGDAPIEEIKAKQPRIRKK